MQNSIYKDEGGISVIVGTLLVIAIFIAAFAAIYPAYSRVSVQSAESGHMQNIADSFLDIQSQVGQMSTDGETRTFNIQMTTGSYPPLVRYPKSGGTLSSRNIHFGYLEFAASNFFYPDQTYVYEGGAVIVIEDNKAWMRSSPSLIYVENLPGNRIFVKVTKTQIQGEGSSISGVGNAKVEITVTDYIEKPINPTNEVVENFDNYAHNKTKNAWENYLEERKEELKDVGYDVTRTGLEIRIGTEGGGVIFHREVLENIKINII